MSVLRHDYQTAEVGNASAEFWTVHILGDPTACSSPCNEATKLTAAGNNINHCLL